MTLGISLVSQRTKQPARKAFLPQSLSFKSRLYIGFVASKTLTSLRQVWVLFQRTCEFNGIQFIKHFSEFVFVETNEVDRSNSNVILTRQTCGHRSSRVVGSKRRALVFYFCEAHRKPPARATRIQSESIRTVPQTPLFRFSKFSELSQTRN